MCNPKTHGKKAPNPHIPALTPISSSQTAADISSMRAAGAGRCFGANPPVLETPFSFQGRCQLILGTIPPFIFGFPITPEAAPPKVIPLIHLGGCSLSASPLPSRDACQAEIRIHWLQGGGGKEVLPSKHEVEGTICHQDTCWAKELEGTSTSLSGHAWKGEN